MTEYRVEVYNEGQYNQKKTADATYTESTLADAMGRAKSVLEDWGYTPSIRTPGGAAEGNWEIPSGSISLFESGQPGEVLIREVGE